MSNYLNLEMRKTVKLDSRERSSEFRKLYEITGVVGVGGGGTVYAGMTVELYFFFQKEESRENVDGCLEILNFGVQNLDRLFSKFFV